MPGLGVGVRLDLRKRRSDWKEKNDKGAKCVSKTKTKYAKGAGSGSEKHSFTVIKREIWFI